MNQIRKRVGIGVALFVFMTGCAGLSPQAGPGEKQQTSSHVPPPQAGGGARDKDAARGAREGDLVRVNYTAALEDGILVYSTLADAAREPGRKKAPGYQEPKVFAPEAVVAGRPAKVPGLGQAVVGMAPGQRKKVTIPPESAFGRTDPRKVQTLPTERTFPRTLRMSAEKYVQQFGTFPIQGKEVEFAPFLKARIKEVTETGVLMDMTAKDGDTLEVEYGTIQVQLKDEKVVITLTPRLGAPFPAGGAEGKISGVDGKSFTVDFNPPLVGKPIVLDVEVTALTRAEELASMKISWTENAEEGLAAAKKEGKPTVLVLYADWCSWCKRLFAESLLDPRIRILQDRLVWIKVNSDKNADIKKKYGQVSFPTIVFLQPDGEVSKKVEGFLDAAALQEELKTLIHSAKGA